MGCYGYVNNIQWQNSFVLVIAWVYQTLEDYEQALDSLSRAVEVVEKSSDTYAQVSEDAIDALPDQWTIWAEEALYGHSMGLIRYG